VGRSSSEEKADGTAMNVGFAGLGRMGVAMARNVLRAGFPLTVYNRTPERTAALVDEGARAAEEPAGLGSCDVVVTMVSDGVAARSILVDGGVFDALLPGSLVLEMSTIGPMAAAELADDAARRGIHLLDAPVSGSVSVAESGQLFAMVGGDARAYERARPVLDAMTKGHVRLGPSGAGAAMKLALNSMIAATNESIAETLALATRFGIDGEDAYDVLAGGVLASPFVLYKRGAFLHPDTEPVAFTTGLMRKDLALVDDLATRLEVRMPVTRAATSILEEALEHDLAEADMASVLRVLNGDSAIPKSRAHSHREDS
jgi:3-hydroxyisobutyrate dehydrogenase-like beta-hydroxyacid dehydrogenase